MAREDDELNEFMDEVTDVCQGTLMSTKRTLTSLGCGDSSMVALHLEAG